MAVDQCESAAETPAAHFGNGDLWELAHDVDDFSDAAEAAGAAAIILPAHVVEIAAGRVRIACAGGDDAANLIIFGEGAQEARQFGEQDDAQRVFLFGAAER